MNNQLIELIISVLYKISISLLQALKPYPFFRNNSVVIGHSSSVFNILKWYKSAMRGLPQQGGRQCHESNPMMPCSPRKYVQTVSDLTTSEWPHDQSISKKESPLQLPEGAMCGTKDWAGGSRETEVHQQAALQGCEPHQKRSAVSVLQVQTFTENQ